MIRSLGFLTGVVVTGTAVWALSDGVAAKAALDSLSGYLAESDAVAESGPAEEETDRRILPPASIMSRNVESPALPAATQAASPARGEVKHDSATPPVAGSESPSASNTPPTEVSAQATEAGSAPNVTAATDVAGMAGAKASSSMARPGPDGEPGPVEQTAANGTEGTCRPGKVIRPQIRGMKWMRTATGLPSGLLSAATRRPTGLPNT